MSRFDETQSLSGMAASGNVTVLLERARSGSEGDLEALVVEVYRELRRTAAGLVGRERGNTLMATDLVHEAFLRLFRGQEISWENRRHFFASAAMAMRRVLVDHARRKKAGKRIPAEEMVSLQTAELTPDSPDLDMIELDRALEELAKIQPRQARIVELRFFAGLTETEIAELLNVSRMTVSRDWKVARLRLRKEMRK